MSEKTKLTREQMIEQLVDTDVSAFLDDSNFEHELFLKEAIRDGLRGYTDFTDEELVEALRQRGVDEFGEEISR